MLIIHGTYHWKPRRVAFRNDYCRTCEAGRLSVLIRTIDFLHAFWIPILPLGVWSRWHCTHCSSRPHESTRTRRGYKIAGAVILALLSAAAWAPWPVLPSDLTDRIMLWALRLGLPLATVLTIRSAVRHQPEPNFKRLLEQVLPYEGWQCPLCGGQLFNLPKWHCMNCGAEHRPLRKA